STGERDRLAPAGDRLQLVFRGGPDRLRRLRAHGVAPPGCRLGPLIHGMALDPPDRADGDIRTAALPRRPPALPPLAVVRLSLRDRPLPLVAGDPARPGRPGRRRLPGCTEPVRCSGRVVPV